MTIWDGRLLAATSAWRAGFHVSPDGGASWLAFHDHPTPYRSVSRVVKLAPAKSFFLGHLIDVGRNRLLSGDAQGVAVLEGWPEDLRIAALAAAEHAVYVAANQPSGIGLWRSDGAALERLAGALPAGRVQDFHWAEGRLWLLTAEGDGVFVWSSSDGSVWRRELRLLGGTPWGLFVDGGGLYIGGAGDGGLGVIWAYRFGGGPPSVSELSLLPARETPQSVPDWRRAQTGWTGCSVKAGAIAAGPYCVVKSTVLPWPSRPRGSSHKGCGMKAILRERCP